MHVPGVVRLLAAWCLSSWWCVLWIENKLPLSNMSYVLGRVTATTADLLLALADTRHIPRRVRGIPGEYRPGGEPPNYPPPWTSYELRVGEAERSRQTHHLVAYLA
jgi:hypothetical protein